MTSSVLLCTCYKVFSFMVVKWTTQTSTPTPVPLPYVMPTKCQLLPHESLQVYLVYCV